MKLLGRYLAAVSLLAGLALLAACSTPEDGSTWDKDALWKQWESNRSR
jgi:hypothetical protein